MATKTQNFQLSIGEVKVTKDERMQPGVRFDMPDFKLGDKKYNLEVVGADRINEKVKEWQKNQKFMNLYASAYLFSPAWNPYIKEQLAEERIVRKQIEAENKKAVEEHHPLKPIPESEVLKLVKLFKQDPDKGVETLLDRINNYKRPSSWSAGDDEVMTWVIEQLDKYIQSRTSGAFREPEGYYPDAAIFYQGLVRQGKGIMVAIKDKETNELTAMTFLITGKTCMKNSTPTSKEVFKQKMENMHADPNKTVYVAEMFIDPELRSTPRSGNMIKLMLRQSQQWADAYAFTHILSWTPGEEGDKTNPVINMENFFGLKNLGAEEHGIDVKMIKGRIRFAPGPDNALWRGVALDDTVNTDRL